MDLNHILLWFAVISAASLCWRSIRVGRRTLSWTLVSAFVLLVALVAWWLVPDIAGELATLFMVLFLLVPSRLSQAATRASEQQRYGRARRLARFAALLHPTADWRTLPHVYHAFELAQAGQLGEAEARLQLLARTNSGLAPTAQAQRLRLLGRWRELKELAERQGLLTLRTQPALFSLYLRALGELGCIDELSRFLLAQERTLAATGAQDLAFLYLFAFSGQVELTRQVLEAKRQSYPTEVHDFWLAVATQSAGHPQEARRVFGRLRSSKDAQIRARAEERFDSLGRAAPEDPPSAQTTAVVARFARTFAERQRFSLSAAQGRRKNQLTLGLIAINTAIYVVGSFPELLETRQSFGERWAFIATDIFAGQWWRTFSYLFVHASALHLLMNLGGLWVLGPSIERAFGRLRFCVIYLVAGFAGSATYLALAVFQGSKEELVGASGCIMGLLGANAAVMLRAWLKHRAPMARQVFLRLLAIVALQVVFDYTANHSGSDGPQIAALAHAVGLLGGFLAALLLRDEVSAARIAEYVR